jgi:hypothetical protein
MEAKEAKLHRRTLAIQRIRRVMIGQLARGHVRNIISTRWFR